MSGEAYLRLAYEGAESLSGVQQVGAVGGFHQDRELVPAPARQHVAGSDGPAESRRHARQGGVPKDVTEGVVDRLEMVDVCDQEPKAPAVSDQVLQSPREGGIEEPPVGQTGEVVRESVATGSIRVFLYAQHGRVVREDLHGPDDLP